MITFMGIANAVLEGKSLKVLLAIKTFSPKYVQNRISKDCNIIMLLFIILLSYLIAFNLTTESNL